MPEKAVSVFLSYSQKDRDWLEQLKAHLAGLVTNQKITIWYNGDIEAGAEWEPAIRENLNGSDIIIPLISSDFLASEYSYGRELLRAIERHDNDEARVIPVILRSCDWEDSPFGKLKVLPEDKQAVTTWKDKDEAFLLVVKSIKKAVQTIHEQRLALSPASTQEPIAPVVPPREPVSGVLNRVDKDGRLYKALLKLGYRKQVNLFRKFLQTHQILAFLIYGKCYYGQRWLLNRLVVQHTIDNITGKVIKISLDRVGRQSNVAALWQELATKTGLGWRGTQSEIIDRVYQWWRTQNVLLLIYDVDFLPESFLEEMLRDFWVPLASKTWKNGRPESKYKLLMFLVDYDGKVGGWNIPFTEEYSDVWHPQTPVKLPIISEFSKEELVNWLDYSADDLPISLSEQLDEVAATILEKSDNGIPEPTFDEICRWVGEDWFGKEDLWMKY